MQHELPILINITVALLAAFIGGLLARRLKLPPMVGYMLAGVAIGPFTPGFSGDLFTIQQLAELGVIFLLFDVGLHFSLHDLWAVRDTVICGALIQTILITGLGLLLAHLWGWSLAAGILLGLALSIASTVVMIRSLMDRGLLSTSHGQVAIGWLVLEDLVAVLILVLLPALSTALHCRDCRDYGRDSDWRLVCLRSFPGARCLPGRSRDKRIGTQPPGG